MARLIPAFTLQEAQADPERLRSAGVRTLAWLMHEAEYAADDMTFLAIQAVLEERGRQEQHIVHEEYMRQWPEHAKARGYAKTT